MTARMKAIAASVQRVANAVGWAVHGTASLRGRTALGKVREHRKREGVHGVVLAYRAESSLLALIIRAGEKDGIARR